MPLGLTDRDAAKLVGCSHVAIGKAKKFGRIMKLSDGTLAPNAVMKWNNERRTSRGNRIQVTTAALLEVKPDPLVISRVRLPLSIDSDAGNAAAALALLNAEGVFADRADAERYRDSYVARLRQIEFDQKSGAVVDAAEAARKTGEACARVRNRLLALPAEQAPQLHRCQTVVELQDVLLGLLTRALEDLTA